MPVCAQLNLRTFACTRLHASPLLVQTELCGHARTNLPLMRPGSPLPHHSWAAKLQRLGTSALKDNTLAAVLFSQRSNALIHINSEILQVCSWGGSDKITPLQPQRLEICFLLFLSKVELYLLKALHFICMPHLFSPLFSCLLTNLFLITVGCQKILGLVTECHCDRRKD